MSASAPFLTPSEAARRLGVSAKALRIYEKAGLIRPPRSAAGWRVYGPSDIDRVAGIVTLRALGLSLAQVGQVLTGDPGCLSPALTAHLATLENRAGDLAGAIDRVRRMLADLARGAAPSLGELSRMLRPDARPAVAFALPWPWGGERFALPEVRALTFITGPLLSGKTRLARMIADTLPGCAFIEVDRHAGDGATAHERAASDPVLRESIDRAMAWLEEDGATATPALAALVTILEADGPTALVIDMVEQGLDQATQEALTARLRRRAPDARPLFLLTRSNAILDLDAPGADDAVVFCPANHSPPMLVAPYPGARGYEAVASCLGSPEVRARTEGYIVMRAPAE